MASKSALYFTKVVATSTGNAFLVGHVQDQGSEPTFTRFARAGDAGWGLLGDLGAVVHAASAVPMEGSPRVGVAVLGRQGPLRLYMPGQPPADIDVPLKDKTADFEGLCAASDGLYVCGGQRQVLRYAGGQWQSIDQGLFVKFDGSNDCNLFAIAEIAPGRVMVVGNGGFIAVRGANGAWQTVDAGTNLDLLAVIAAGDGGAWVAGDGGTLLKVSADLGTVQDCGAPDVSTASFDGLALHKGEVYVTAFNAVLTWSAAQGLQAVSGSFQPGSEFHSVHAAGDYLWVTGDEHAYRLSPGGWQYFLCPDNV